MKGLSHNLFMLLSHSRQGLHPSPNARAPFLKSPGHLGEAVDLVAIQGSNKKHGLPNKAINSGRIAARFVEWHLVGVVQPLAIMMNEGVYLAVEVDPSHIQRRLDTGYCDEMASTLDEALNQVREACHQGQPLSIGLIGNAAEVYPELVRRGITPDLVTDQTSAHDALR